MKFFLFAVLVVCICNANALENKTAEATARDQVNFYHKAREAIDKYTQAADEIVNDAQFQIENVLSGPTNEVTEFGKELERWFTKFPQCVLDHAVEVKDTIKEFGVRVIFCRDTAIAASQSAVENLYDAVMALRADVAEFVDEFHACWRKPNVFLAATCSAVAGQKMNTKLIVDIAVCETAFLTAQAQIPPIVTSGYLCAKDSAAQTLNKLHVIYEKVKVCSVSK